MNFSFIMKVRSNADFRSGRPDRKLTSERRLHYEGFSETAQRQLFGGNKGGRGQGPVTFGSNRYKWISPESQQQQQTRVAATQQLSTPDIVRTLATEVQTMFEEGKMWPFTCIGFEKDLPSLPGFQDFSMEEMRLEAYKAQKSGNIQAFEQKFRNLVNSWMAQRQELKAPSVPLKQKLIEFIDDVKKKKNSGSFGQTNLFSGGQTNSSPFSGGSTGPLFGSSGSQGSSGQFSIKDTTSTSTFGQSGQQSIFGQSSTFGQMSGFGQTQSFGAEIGFSQSAQPQSAQMFGQAAGQTGTGQTIFGQTVGGTGSGQTIFGQTVGQSGTSQTIFGQTISQPSPLFGQPQTPKATLFGKSESPLKSSSFQTPVPNSGTQQSFFGTSTSTPQSSTPVSNTFGGMGAHSGTGFGTAQTTTKTSIEAEPEESAYTPLDKLTAEELEQFRSQTFTPGKVPIKPPPRELCF